MFNSDFLIEDGVLIKYQGLETKVEIPNGIKVVRTRAFRGLDIASVKFREPSVASDNLLGLDVEESSYTFIEESAFRHCIFLKSVSLPEKVSVIGPRAFCECPSIEEIVIPGCVSEIREYTFYGCRSLKTVYLPDTLKIIKNGSFQNCNALTDIYLPSGVYIEGFAFDFTENYIKNIRFHYK